MGEKYKTSLCEDRRREEDEKVITFVQLPKNS